MSRIFLAGVHGDVSVQSEPTKGTVVTLTFPDAETNGAVTRRSNQV